MKPKSPQFYEVRARVAKAMAHPESATHAGRPPEKERCVCKTELVGADQSTVSSTAVLKQSGAG
jgi:hypothetical protein